MYKIFLVEDDPVIRRAVAKHLAMWGYQVQAVENYSRILEEFVGF